jgi:sugar phosphate isomerase/epimerase
MNVGISTRCFGAAALTVDSLERLRKSGFERIEIHANRPAFNFHNKSLVRGIGQWFKENALPPPTIHLPFEEELDGGNIRALSVVDAQPLARQHAVDELKRCLELSDRIDIEYVVLHLGIPDQAFHPVVFDYAYAAIAALQSFSGVRVLLENTPNGIASLDRLVEFIAVTKLTNVAICYDTGHGNVHLQGSPPGSDVAAMHINDSNSSSDEHLWPFDGKSNWPLFVERLITSSFNGPLVLEAADNRIERAQDSRSRLGDLMGEAQNSVEEFRLKYKLPAPKHEDHE